jgi:glycosyltransferase involved in cell wall biosynthesis
MKIALVASSYLPRPDGFERHVGKLAGALARSGVQVQVLTQDASRKLPRVFNLDGVLVRRFHVPMGAGHGAVAPGLWEALRRGARAFDLAHVHTPHPSFAAALMRVGPSRKVFTPHAPMRLLLRWPHMRVTRSVVEHAAMTLCTSIADSELLAERIPSAADRISELVGGVEADAIATAQPYPHPGVVVLALGPLERRTRIDRAIGAMASLSDPYHLVVAGGGSSAFRLAAHAEDLRVSPRVEFIGPVRDAERYRWLRTAGVLVALSDQATSGIEVAEAISAGIPVVATDIPVHREAVARSGGAGATFVSAEGSPLEVADAIELAIRPRPGVLAPAPVSSWDAVAAATLMIYAHSANGHGSNGARPAHAPDWTRLA